ncbi:unnamed protein product [Chondrus crispus]|uniref:Uncharacterized protein n=1 Tax=Chondrus crispus TaxID=2769 RepID=R7QIN5_CHOCR|nr:unnamed protein product [Chondrus crispus]CDF37608.1 unnamed protein product [Chondrus crispus]|eukprot:XP_005717479.1 unnamed protein product [Chondrus crispus]
MTQILTDRLLTSLCRTFASPLASNLASTARQIPSKISDDEFPLSSHCPNCCRHHLRCWRRGCWRRAPSHSAAALPARSDGRVANFRYPAAARDTSRHAHALPPRVTARPHPESACVGAPHLPTHSHSTINLVGAVDRRGMGHDKKHQKDNEDELGHCGFDGKKEDGKKRYGRG